MQRFRERDKEKTTEKPKKLLTRKCHRVDRERWEKKSTIFNVRGRNV